MQQDMPQVAEKIKRLLAEPNEQNIRKARLLCDVIIGDSPFPAGIATLMRSRVVQKKKQVR